MVGLAVGVSERAEKSLATSDDGLESGCIRRIVVWQLSKSVCCPRFVVEVTKEPRVIEDFYAGNHCMTCKKQTEACLPGTVILFSASGSSIRHRRSKHSSLIETSSLLTESSSQSLSISSCCVGR